VPDSNTSKPSCSIARSGLWVGYYRTHRLLKDVAISRIDGSILIARSNLHKLHRLVLDEWGFRDLDDHGKEHMLYIFEDRAGSASTIVIGRRAIAERHAFFAHQLLADALLERILCRSYNIKLKGRSLRARKPFRQ
jgi:DNA replication protein DnaC